MSHQGMDTVVLGSGSKGNSLVLRNGRDAIMIDAGFQLSELMQRLQATDVALESIRAVFVTHGHVDHVSGAADMVRHAGVPLHMTEDLFLAGTQGSPSTRPWLNLSREEVVLFKVWDKISVGGFQVIPVPVSHDSATTVGFVITVGDFKLALATDTGDISKDTGDLMMGADVIMLESNYDNDMLWKSGKRPLWLKERITGPMGHLSNTRCADILSGLITEKTRDVVLLHLSSECNTPELAVEAVRAKNSVFGDGSVRLHVANQDEPFSFNIQSKPH